MRLWSLDPKYLDSKGLVAVWRESLLAKSVLQGKTRGYKNHPQLKRFKEHSAPLKALNYYLFKIFNEAKNRNYNFDKNKIGKVFGHIRKIKVNLGQIEYEFNHLKRKLKKRDYLFYEKLIKVKEIKTHPLFIVVKGGIEDWEKVDSKIKHDID